MRFEVRPQVVVSQSPERNLDRIFASHPDHLATGEAAMSAVPKKDQPPKRDRERDKGKERELQQA